MGRVSIEIKARCSAPARIRAILRTHKARFRGLDHQIDTYFCVPFRRRTDSSNDLWRTGRLKLREGNIENALIYYKRDNQKNSKKCDATLFSCKKGSPLKNVLTQALGILITVDKKREIYFIKNIKFHIDRVKRLGNFVEIEVFGSERTTSKLKAQCELYQKLLGIRARDLVADSYSDQLLRLQT